MENKQLIIIGIFVLIAGCIVATGCYFALSPNNSNHDEINATNNNTTANVTNTTNSTNDSVQTNNNNNNNNNNKNKVADSSSSSESHYSSSDAARNSKNYDLKLGEQNKNDYIYSAEGNKMYWTNDGYDGSYRVEGDI